MKLDKALDLMGRKQVGLTKGSYSAVWSGNTHMRLIPKPSRSHNPIGPPNTIHHVQDSNGAILYIRSLIFLQFVPGIGEMGSC